MKIKITNPKHKLFGITYDVLYKDGKDFVVLIQGVPCKIFNKDCEVLNYDS